MDRPAANRGYSTRDVAALLGLSAAQVRSYVRAGFLSPGQGARGEYLFSFQDLILLRTAKGLLAARVPHRRIRRALARLHDQLPAGRPLTGVRISAEGHQVVVRDGGEVWHPESGQALFDFDVAELARQAATFAERAGEGEEVDGASAEEPESASAWYERGVELEAADAAAAIAAYERALELDDELADAHLNLGRLLHERGEPAAAERHYRRALAARPGEPTAAYNLGVALQDLGRLDEAAAAYESALAADGAFADAHYNLAGIYETLGQRKAAFRHLKSYKALLDGAGV
jgi:tetratricopeptide (TPR) repeat protein